MYKQGQFPRWFPRAPAEPALLGPCLPRVPPAADTGQGHAHGLRSCPATGAHPGPQHRAAGPSGRALPPAACTSAWQMPALLGPGGGSQTGGPCPRVPQKAHSRGQCEAGHTVRRRSTSELDSVSICPLKGRTEEPHCATPAGAPLGVLHPCRSPPTLRASPAGTRLSS